MLNLFSYEWAYILVEVSVREEVSHFKMVVKALLMNERKYEYAI